MKIDWTHWPDYAAWPDEQIDAYEQMLGGLLSGDLGPLASYILAGYPLGGGAAEILADAILRTGDAKFHLAVTATKPGGRIGFDQSRHERRLRLGATAHVCLRSANRAEHARTWEAVAKRPEFNTTVSAVREALTYFRKCLLGNGSNLEQFDPIGAAIILGEVERAHMPEN